MAEIARLHPAEDKSFRLAPHNVEAEQALLGAILLNNDAFYRVSDFLEPVHFYEPIHRDIYELPARSSAPASRPIRPRSRPTCPSSCCPT